MSYQQGYQYTNVPGSDQGGGGNVDDSMTNPLAENASGQHGTNTNTNTNTDAANNVQGPESGSGAGNYQQEYGGQGVGVGAGVTNEHMSLSSNGSNQQHQPLNPQSYHLPSYQDYVQNNVYNHPPGQGPAPGPGPGPIPANFGSYGQNIGTMDWSDLNRRSKKNRRMIGLAAGLFILLALVSGGNSSTYKSDSSGANDGSVSGNSVAHHVVHANHKNHNGIAGDGKVVDHSASSTTTTASTTSASTTGTTSASTSSTNANSNSKAGTVDDHLKIIYLLTYPMSGTSYTMRLYTTSTNTSIATNYALQAHTDDNGHIFPVYSKSNEESHADPKIGSPYWASQYSSTNNPSEYLVTLSHCHGFCLYPCSPAEYLTSLSSFEAGCRTVSAIAEEEKVKNHPGFYAISLENFYTPREKQAKLIHLIREPLSNVVSRFHQYLNINPDKKEGFPKNMGGFRAWCKIMDDDAELHEVEATTLLISEEMWRLMADVPCRNEFYKYVTWHNRVMEIKWNENSPHLVVYYEDYNNSAGGETIEAKRMAKFAGIDEDTVDRNMAKVPDLLKELTIRMYRDYYTKEERAKIEAFVRSLALADTMKLLERYFAA